MLMIDKIGDVQNDNVIRGIKNVTSDEEFFLDHFPTNPVMPGSLIMESMFQLASWLISISTSFEYMSIVRNLKRAKFKKIVRPGEQIDVRLKIILKNDDYCTFEGTAYVNHDLVVVATFDVTMIPFIEFQAKEYAKEIFSIVAGNGEQHA